MRNTAAVICTVSWLEQTRKSGRGLPAKRKWGRLAHATIVAIVAATRRGKLNTGREFRSEGSMVKRMALMRKVRTALWITMATVVQ